MNIIFNSWYVEIIFFNFIKIYCQMHVFCADFDPKLEEVLSVHHSDLFLSYFGSHDSSAVSSLSSRLVYYF